MIKLELAQTPASPTLSCQAGAAAAAEPLPPACLCTYVGDRRPRGHGVGSASGVRQRAGDGDAVRGPLPALALLPCCAAAAASRCRLSLESARPRARRGPETPPTPRGTAAARGRWRRSSARSGCWSRSARRSSRRSGTMPGPSARRTSRRPASARSAATDRRRRYTST